MSSIRDINNGADNLITKTNEKEIDTFDDVKSFDSSSRINTFEDLKGRGTDRSINTFEDLRNVDQHRCVNEGSIMDKSENLSAVSTKLSINDGRHRLYVAAKEGFNNIPVNLNDIYTEKDGKWIIDKRGMTHVNIDKDILNSVDMQDLMKEDDFRTWAVENGSHKGLSYNDHVKDFNRLSECQDLINKGHSSGDIEGILGKEHAETYKRFYKGNPIKIDRTIEVD